ncbi:hypothetical protein GO986_16740 [Deinococcus sp. HMF7620]|uniref:Uncharacterized protein n=1 Tax=Deinococcus arboris TaxID=2682977 RepID=A0A7C9HTB3_9DEIO|nr:hypothetical protein [Deinococcus arboris]MVN88393.1 hypothetical protein [Deinococcus arboris]
MTRPGETYRGPPPSVSAAVLMLGVMGAALSFFAAALLVPSDHRPLRWVLALSPFVGLIWAGQVRGHQVHPETALAVPLAVAWVPFMVSGSALRLVRQEALGWMDGGMLLMAAGVLMSAVFLSLHSARHPRA